MRNKNGSHVGVTISFVIFIMFIFFIYIIIQPTLTNRGNQNFIKSIESVLIEEFSSEVKTASVKILSVPGTCISLNDFLTETEMNGRIIVTGSEDNIFSADISGNNLEVSPEGNTFFKIYHSEEFDLLNGGLESCDPLNPGSGYEIGFLKTGDEIFSSKINEIAQEYESDLNALREKLNISEENEFGFGFTYENGTSIDVGEENVQGTNFYVKEVQITYVEENGLKKMGLLRTRVW